eukprot:307015-Lingulodinium_polyedra.AAC.1
MPGPTRGRAASWRRRPRHWAPRPQLDSLRAACLSHAELPWQACPPPHARWQPLGGTSWLRRPDGEAWQQR